MTDSPNIHWTEDPELLEQFVMHRVDDTRRKELEAHMLQCEECQLAVRNEQELVLGIKRIGRGELKARLKERLAVDQAEPVRTTIPWVQIASAAAVIVIVAGLGVYNRWFPFQDDLPVIVDYEEQEAAPTKPAVAGKPGERQDAGRREADLPKKLPDDQKRITLQPQSESSRSLESLARREPESLRDAAGETQPPQALILTSPDARERVGAAKTDAAARDDAIVEDALKDDISPTQIWVDGAVLLRHAADAKKPALPAAKEQRADLDRIASRLAEETKSAVVKVTELSLNDLPPARKARQQQLEDQAIQTQIEQSQGEIHFMVYRKNPTLKGKPQQAIVQQVGKDSLVISVGNEQIGYRIPGGLDALMTLKK